MAKAMTSSLSSRSLQSISQYKPALMHRGPVCGFQASEKPSRVNFTLHLAKRGGFVAESFDFPEEAATAAAAAVGDAPTADAIAIEVIANDYISNVVAQQQSRRFSISGKDLARAGGELVGALVSKDNSQSTGNSSSSSISSNTFRRIWLIAPAEVSCHMVHYTVHLQLQHLLLSLCRAIY